MGHAQDRGTNCSGSVTLDPEDAPVTGGSDFWEPPFTCVACASLTARRSGWLLSASVDVKETSNVQCGLAADEAADLAVGVLVMLSLMLVVISVVAGTLLFLTFIGFSLPFPVLWLTMMVGMVLLLILWFGPLVPSPRGVGWFTRFGTPSPP